MSIIMIMCAKVLLLVVSLVLIYILCFRFPRKCDKCGKFLTYKYSEVFTSSVVMGGMLVITDKYFLRKKCLNCGYVTPRKKEADFEYVSKEELF